jgi:ADP-ribose pyrophosphatase YjhB (NUDIX family)
MPRIIRYQGAIVKDDHVLLLRHLEHGTGRSYWLFPGGGIEDGETEEQCVSREMFEETGLIIQVERLLFTQPMTQPDTYKQRNIYLCKVISGEAKPGYEPEEDAQVLYGIVEVKWFDLRFIESWSDEVLNERLKPQILELKTVLGY